MFKQRFLRRHVVLHDSAINTDRGAKKHRLSGISLLCRKDRQQEGLKVLMLLTAGAVLLSFVSYSFWNISSTMTLGLDVKPNIAPSTAMTTKKDVVSKAHICNTEMTWDAHHHLDAFSKNMHSHYKEDWQVSTYFENLCGGTYL